jgi:hypothetical protein
LNGLRFRLEHQGVLIAESNAELMSMHGRHVVRLYQKEAPSGAETLTALMMADLLIQKYEES